MPETCDSWLLRAIVIEDNDFFYEVRQESFKPSNL